MRHAEAAPPLRRHIEAGRPGERFLHGAGGSVALDGLCGATGSPGAGSPGTSLGGRLGELAGRSVLLAVRDQLPAALALIELDGVARRVVLCPPDLAAKHLPEIAANAEADAIVSDRDPADIAALGIPLHVAATPAIAAAPAGAKAAELPAGGHRTTWLLLTSGTTGAPKIVGHDVTTLSAPIRPVSDPPVWGTFYDIRRYGGLQIFFRAVIGGGSLILSQAGEPVADHLARLARHGVTHLSGTPSHWRRALMSPALRAIAPGYVRLSGEIADQAILDSLHAFFPLASIGHAYASTEAGVGFEVNDGLAGFPASFVDVGHGDVDIKIEDGSLRLRSRRTAASYVGHDAPQLRDGDGFVDTGDMVERRGERYHFVGRKGGIINVGGQKVNPEEVEAAINLHPAVWGSLVRARRNPITGAIVAADVVLKDPSLQGDVVVQTEREIIALCRENIAPYKVPALIRFVASLAVSESGKLLRHGDS
jgi:acyl-coenzyme A synthetase/AMP-(fatty) acid ligase